MSVATTQSASMTSLVTPALYEVVISHARTSPIKHSFRYDSYSWLVDLDALPHPPRGLGALARFDAADHFDSSPGSLREKADHFLRTQGVELHGGRIVMLAQARVLGYSFNPLSVYWCFTRAGDLSCVIAEVHNTYGDRHAYLLHTDHIGRAETDKEFYVSPFNPVDGRYLMRLPIPDGTLSLTITLDRPGSMPFVATVSGTRLAPGSGSLLRVSLRHPVAPLLGSARIRRQGIALWLRGLRPVTRPSHRQEGVQ